MVHTNIFQSNHVKRTSKNADARLIYQPTFTGEVTKTNYIIVDDALTMGGTVASLKGYIENRGGKCIGAMVMASKEYSLKLVPEKNLINNIHEKHGSTVDSYLEKEIGYKTSRLTNSEARHLFSMPNVNAIRARVAQTTYVESARVDEKTTTATGKKNLQAAEITLKLRESHHPKAVLRTVKPTAPCRGVVVDIKDDLVIQQVADNSRFFQAHKVSDLPLVPKIFLSRLCGGSRRRQRQSDYPHGLLIQSKR